MKILCVKCKNYFEEPNLRNDSCYKVECPKCGKKFKAKTKRTKVKLPFYYKTRIEEPSKDLVIEKKGDGLKPVLCLCLGIFVLAMPIFMILDAIHSGDPQKVLPGDNKLLELFKFIMILGTGIYFIILAYCSFVNTTEVRVGEQGITMYVHPYEWISETKGSYHSTDGINQIYVKKQAHQDGDETYYLYHLYAIANKREDIELGIFESFDVARGLEILIEKRLGIEDREIEGEELGGNVTPFL